ncbi:MAG: ergosterol biosynthesis protein [Deltaproteobacteria bacterium]|nr:ergosterol biosynthesis protein [Deltaproteobacteria bacterium]
MDLVGFAAPLCLYALTLLLHLAIPTPWIAGYVRDDDGAPLRYRCNGMLVLIAVATIQGLAANAGVIAWDFWWQHRVGVLAGVVTIGLVFTLVVVLTAPSQGGALLRELFLGRRENPRLLGGRVDVKMFLYLAGAVLLQLNLQSFFAHHVLLRGGTAVPGAALHLAAFSFFVLDYLFFERVHLYTYDFFAERVGFKLGWGCLAFYPSFYAVGLWAVADCGGGTTPPGGLVLAMAAFVAGWCLARGANLQKYLFKLDPNHRFLGLFEPVALEHGDRRLLCSGFWGLSRHINYLGEILMASGLALALSWPPDWAAQTSAHGWFAAFGPWLYPLYYVVLLVPRERDDHRRCAAKYGPLWEAYCRRVRWRIVPGIY